MIVYDQSKAKGSFKIALTHGCGSDGELRKVPLYLVLLTRREAAPACVYMQVFKYKLDKYFGEYELLFGAFVTEKVAVEFHDDLATLPSLELPNHLEDRSDIFYDLPREEGTAGGDKS